MLPRNAKQKFQALLPLPVAALATYSLLSLVIFPLGLHGSAKAQPGSGNGTSSKTHILGWWRGEGNVDDSASDNDDCEITSVTYAAGKVGKAMKFNGKDSRASLCDSPSLQTNGSFSIEGWLFVRAYNELGMVIFRGDNRVSLDPYYLCTTASGNLRFHIGSESEAGVASIEAPIKLGQWTHFAATLDDTSGEMSLYLDGLKAAQATTTVRPLIALQRSENPGVGIGNHSGWHNSSHRFPYDGLIDELSLYSGALTLDQIQEIVKADSTGKPDSLKRATG